MSSITIITTPEGKEWPQWVCQQLVGLDVGLTSPQTIICLGCQRQFERVESFHDAYAVSLTGLIFAAKLAGKTDLLR